MMAPKTGLSPQKPVYPGKRPELEPDEVPEPPLEDKDLLDLVPDEEEFIEAPEEAPPPGEGP